MIAILIIGFILVLCFLEGIYQTVKSINEDIQEMKESIVKHKCNCKDYGVRNIDVE